MKASETQSGLFVVEACRREAAAAPRLLLVEDDRVDRMAFRRFIEHERLDYRITEVDHLAEARRQLAAAPFDALILDYHLPDGLGSELIGATGEIPIIFVTGADSLDLAVEAMRAGAADYLVKDPDRTYLKLLPHTLARTLAERRNRARQRILETHLNHMRKLEAIGSLAGGIAHEFNNLLTSIMGNVQLAEWELIPAHPSIPQLQNALTGCRRARDQIKRLLTFSEETEGEATTIDLPAAIRDAADLMRMTLPRAVEVAVTETAGCPAIRCVADELTGALLQLAQNAAHAMNHRGVIRITLDHNPPSPEMLERHPQLTLQHVVRLSVRDTGSGMAPSVMERLFEPFHTTKGPGGGAGLGLAGVYGVMKRHRGAVAVESTPGLGTSVSLCFPAAGPVPPDGPPTYS